jgi:Flavodoxin reductases (ferredoxin-NADPH reductases) family 1
MSEWQAGTVVNWRRLTQSLATFRLIPEPEMCFPSYEAGQYIALRREHCKLTQIEEDADGRLHAAAQIENGRQKLGPVTHPYSIASPPFEAAEQNRLEFFVVLERDAGGTPGRLSSSLFDMEITGDRTLDYFHRVSGTFTLSQRAQRAESVLMIGTGTGIAPFISMIKQLDHDAAMGKVQEGRVTLIYANRRPEELAYHDDLLKIESEQRFDFVYLPSVSRPDEADRGNPRMGRGRASNILRYVLEMPVQNGERDTATVPALPGHLCRDALQRRFDPTNTVILTCGNPLAVADIKRVGEARGIRVETEDW